MANISQYLKELDRQRDCLAANLTAMGVPANASEKLNTLVPKVLDISQSGGIVPSKTVLFDAEKRNDIYLQFKNTLYSIDEFTALYPDFCSADNEYALNYTTSAFGWDSQVFTCCTRQISIKSSMQIAVRFLSGSTETGVMRLAQSGSNSPIDIINAAQTDGSYIELPFQWIYSTDYVTTLTPCENASVGDYYLVWVGRSNNSHPLVKSIEIYP
ncbi:MAG: hypothetical protein NC320_01215 [Clostridium sp.]|nr:hypothetical protein [Clostridium sp.]